MTNQKAIDSQGVVQVGGNAVITYGLAIGEVKELVQLFLRDNFPALRAEAMAAATENIHHLTELFECKLTTIFEQIDAKKFSDPDIQSSINDAVMAAAKKGDKSNPEILVDLILERVNVSTDDFISLVASEAITIVPKLNKNQISFLSLVAYLRYVKFTSANSIGFLEAQAALAMPAFLASFGISNANKLHIEYSGCASIHTIYVNSAITIWKETYPFFKTLSDEALKSHLETNFPNLHRLSQSFDTDGIAQVSLTSVGQLIGLANLATYMGKLNYSNWIN